jgi:hypothetical protein
MASTMQQLVDRARIPLQDDAKVRYTDATVLGYANAGVHLLVNRRPDLFFGTFTALPVDLTLGQNFPLDDRFFQPVADYASARARARSSEEVRTAQTQLLLALFDQTAIR